MRETARKVGPRLLALALCCCTLFSMAPAASAAPSSPATSHAAAPAASNERFVDLTQATPPTPAEVAMANLAAGFTHFTQERIVFDEAGAVKAGVSPEFAAKLTAMYAGIMQREAARHPDWRKITADWRVTQGWSWGGPYVQLSLTEWETRMIIDALATGAGAAGVYAALTALGIITLPAVPVVVLAGAIAALGAAAINWIDDIGSDHGVYFRWYLIGPRFTCWHN